MYFLDDNLIRARRGIIRNSKNIPKTSKNELNKNYKNFEAGDHVSSPDLNEVKHFVISMNKNHDTDEVPVSNSSINIAIMVYHFEFVHRPLLMNLLMISSVMCCFT